MFIYYHRDFNGGGIMTAANIIKKLKKKSRLTHKKLAEALGLKTVFTLYQIKKGKRYPSRTLWLKIIDLCKNYDIRVELEDLRENDWP